MAAERDRLLHAQIAWQGERDAFRMERESWQQGRSFVPPGHFYSPLPDPAVIRRDAARLFAPPPRTLPGIDLRESEQLALLDRFVTFYPDLPFAAGPQPGLRYFYANDAYSYADAITLCAMLRHLQPRRVVEVGSGHSSCVTLDTVERFLGGRTETVFIEPYPDLLRSLLRPGDAERITIIPSPLEAVPLSRFEALEADDVLFIDSTHVGKIGSDVNRIFAEILPSLRPGVVVHFHDIFYPFEYPRDWIEEGRAWNEAYMLRCFLQYNTRFGVLFWTHFLSLFHADRLAREMPLFMINPGASLWLRVR